MVGPSSNFLTVITTLSVQVIVQVQLLWYGYGSGHSGDLMFPAVFVTTPPQLAILEEKILTSNY